MSASYSASIDSKNQVRSPDQAGSERAVPMRDLIDQELERPSVSRRSFVQVLSGAACAAAWAMESKLRLVEAADSKSSAKQAYPELFHFKSVPASMRDEVVVPEGYVAEVLYRWGDPVDGQSPIFRQDASNSAEDQERQAGMGHDGMDYFAIPNTDPNERGLLAINHEYTDQVLLFSDGLGSIPSQPMPPEKVRKSIASHGVSIIQVQRQEDGSWKVTNSPFSRRITADTPARISGPATSKLGKSVRGTVNNCAAGRTPWNTYLTCEENIQGVFGTNDPNFKPSTSQKAYGMTATGYYYKIDGQKIPAYRWWEHLPRFDLAKPDNDSERFGYVMEIDPLRPESEPVKRTALGRFRHENAEVTLAADGRVVVYMGDDEVNQFIYKFVSSRSWAPHSEGDDVDPLSSNLLDEGTLFAARFEADGTGTWLELAPGKNGIPEKTSSDDMSGFDRADICIRTRMAAEIAGATPMDRAEWIAVHPKTGEAFVSLTNNRSRETSDAANPRAKNIFGHIVRWRELNDDPADEGFRWTVFVLAGNPNHEDPVQHGNSQGDSFACPDGLKFDPTGILWIQTDMSSSVMGKPGYEELGNNMMLAANPESGEIRRFLTGPMGCEITGMAMTPDRKTMFVNIQHPGEPADELSDPNSPAKYSNWPDGAEGGRPRSATIAIRKKDGGFIGS